MHTESPLPTSPWIRTLHPHSPTDFHHLRDQLKSLFNSELSVRGVTSDVITHWGHLDVEAAFQSKLTKLHDEIRQKDQVPLRRKLREIIVDNVDEIIEAGFEDPEADVEWGIDMRKKYRNDRDTASSKRIRYSADVGSPKKKSSIAHTSATDKRTTESSVDYGRPKVKLAESDARKNRVVWSTIERL
ncbi:hypothetical protein BC829DRAFT_215413 [Chytridium lagenaria]|nr:hypothetical protein BC829DRAFT_215413 [Chytridium lagenaria]